MAPGCRATRAVFARGTIANMSKGTTRTRRQYVALRQTAQSLLKQPPVRLASGYRKVVGLALLEKLNEHQLLTVAIAVSSQHVHVLVKAPASVISNRIGDAKRHTWFVMRDHGWRSKLWGLRKKCLPVRDRKHQLNVYDFILRH